MSIHESLIKSSSGSSEMDNLHSDILENILFRLRIEEALHAKRVCTTWRAILRCKTEKPGYLFAFSHTVIGGGMIRKQLFYEDEYNHYDHTNMNQYYSYNTLTEIKHRKYIAESNPRNIMIGSCNGLVCFGKPNISAGGADPFVICNPLTRESLFLPEFNYSDLPGKKSSTTLHHGDDLGYAMYLEKNGDLGSGFGYCPSTNNYKVVRIYYHKEERKAHVQVYTIGQKYWRYYGVVGRFTCGSAGIYANGTLYWLHRNGPKVQECEIVAFDLEHEMFNFIALPRSKYERWTSDFTPVRLLGGNNNLYFVHDRASRIDIWVYTKNSTSTGTSYTMEECNLKQNYHEGRSLCWAKEFSIQQEMSRHFKPFAITRSNDVLLWNERCISWTDSCCPRNICLYCYDRKTSKLRKLWDDKAGGTQCLYIEAIPHMQSVISLKVLGETKARSGAEFLEKPTRSRGAKRKKNC